VDFPLEDPPSHSARGAIRRRSGCFLAPYFLAPYFFEPYFFEPYFFEPYFFEPWRRFFR
jgi:hypothetical protein